MRKLIRKILKEQEEEEFVFPEYKNPDEPKFKYLDSKLKKLVLKDPLDFYGKIFAYPDKKYGILGWRRDGTLFIYYELINEISEKFDLSENETKSIIRKWVSDRYELNVEDTYHSYIHKDLAIIDEELKIL
jgi:hypothetical protein